MLTTRRAPNTRLFLLFSSYCSQIGSNFANDYLDNEKGADTADRTGSETDRYGKISSAMRLATGLTLALAFSIGLMLVPYGGYVHFTGIACVFFAYAYTGGPYPLLMGLGDIFAALFGLIAVK